MRKVILMIIAGCLAGMCAGGLWLAWRPPRELLTTQDTTDIRVAKTGWQEWTLTYRVSGHPYGWYTTVTHQLEANGWAPSGEQYIGGPLNDVPTYTRRTSYGLIILCEQAELYGDAQIAQVRLRRWVAPSTNALSTCAAAFTLRCVLSTPPEPVS